MAHGSHRYPTPDPIIPPFSIRPPNNPRVVGYRSKPNPNMVFNPNVPPMGTNPYQQMPFGYQQNMRYPYSQPNIGYTNQPLVYGYLMPPYVEMVNNHPMDF